ncbi:zinc-binding dehydrogenase [Reyranella sp.]|uniref:zinc-binding dehydrogenase n=2 Tax=Reyranella sp. TaxID=1929291 RepID=UPI003D0F3C19
MAKTTMRAARFDRASRQLSVQDVPVPEPGPGEVLIRVEAAGICASDLHMIDGILPDFPLDHVIPGHEGAGTIARVGAAVPLWQVGQRVVLLAGRNCGVCRHCVGGSTKACLKPLVMGQNYNGSWAEHVVVPFSVLVALPENIPFEQAALIPDAVATPYTGMVHRGRLGLGEAVGLWGIGGLGVHAVQTARLAGAALIIAIDPIDAACQRALELGADHALNPRTMDVHTEVMRLTNGEGLDLAVDLAGVNAALDQAVSCLGRYGRAVIIGMCLEPVHLTEPSVMLGYMNHEVLGHDGYEQRDITGLVRLVASGKLDLSRSVSHVVPLEEVARGVDRLRTKEGNPVRIVVKP